MKFAFVYALSTLLIASACGGPLDHTAEISQALELEYGGLDMEDEAPMFGRESLFEDAGFDLAELVPWDGADTSTTSPHYRLDAVIALDAVSADGKVEAMELLAVWNPTGAGGGRIVGMLFEQGVETGALLGMYGVRANDTRAFHGKLIDNDGHFIGLLVGQYNETDLAGDWFTRAGEVGSISGVLY